MSFTFPLFFLSFLNSPSAIAFFESNNNFASLAFRVEIDIRGVADPKVLSIIPAGEQSLPDRLIQALENNTSVKVLHLNGEILCCFQIASWNEKILL